MPFFMLFRQENRNLKYWTVTGVPVISFIKEL